MLGIKSEKVKISRIENIKLLIDTGNITIGLEKEAFIGIIRSYYSIKDERNNTNHAGKGIAMTASDLKNTILKAIKTIENLQPTKTLRH